MPLVPIETTTKSVCFFAPSSFSRTLTPLGFKLQAIFRKICLGLFGAANATAIYFQKTAGNVSTVSIQGGNAISVLRKTNGFIHDQVPNHLTLVVNGNPTALLRTCYHCSQHQLAGLGCAQHVCTICKHLLKVSLAGWHYLCKKRWKLAAFQAFTSM